MVVLVVFSFQDGRLPVPPLRGLTLEWYAKVLGDRALVQAMVHSVLLAVATSAVALALGFLAAHGLARVRLPGTAAVRLLLVAPMTVSALIIGLGLFAGADGAGLAAVAADGGDRACGGEPALCFAICYAAMGDQQKAAERAARDLGAGEWAVLVQVAAPMLAPALAAAFFLSVTFSWDEFIIAFLLTRFDVTLPVEIWSMLKSGLSPATNAVGSFVFLVSVVAVLGAELVLVRRRA